MRVARSELVADVRRDAGFDAAGAERDESQPGHQPPWRMTEHAHRGERGMAAAIDQRERDDRAVFADENICQQRAEQRRQIHRAVEKMDLGGGLGLAHGRAAMAVHEVQVVHHEDREHGLHAVKRKAFRRLVADDVGHAGRHAFEFCGGCAVGHGGLARQHADPLRDCDHKTHPHPDQRQQARIRSPRRCLLAGSRASGSGHSGRVLALGPRPLASMVPLSAPAGAVSQSGN